jgi:group II intron reverse transcriptase/maturase
MRKSEPHTEAGNPAGPSVGKGYDPVSRRAAIAAKARKNPKEQFNNLLHHLTYELVAECLNDIPNTSAAGVDGMSVKQARENLSWILPPILKQIHEGRYTPPPARRVYIPKADGSKRPLGVPAVIDRAIQGAMAKVLNEIYEQDFLKCSFGFRQGLGCHHALATINELLYRQNMEHVLEVDIRDFFGSLSHEWLMRFLELRIGDRRVLTLIQAWLKAGIFEEGRWQEVERGTPQGGSASPLLANIYLHYVVDLWFERKIKPQFGGKAALVRYADDLCLFFEHPSDVDTMKTLLEARLGQFGLTLAEAKTHKSNLGSRPNSETHERRRLTFLGFTIYRTQSVGKTVIKTVFQTEGKRFSRAKAAMKDRLRRLRHQPVETQARTINQMLRGHFNYYGLAGNAGKLQSFWTFTWREWKHSLSQRSQKGRLTGEAFTALLAKHPLVRPRIRVRYSQFASYARL